MNNPLVLTFDLGTQSARAVLVDKMGNIVFKVQKQFDQPYHSLYPGWAEQSADFYWEAICDCSKELKIIAGVHWDDIIAVTVATIRATEVCLDENGKPLRDAIVWVDNRKAECKSKLPTKSRLLFTAVGKNSTIDLQRKSSHCNWIAENEPEIWAKTKYCVLISAYICFKICGIISDSESSTVGRIPFDYKSRTWRKKSDIIRCIFDIRDDQLYPLVKPESNMGGVTEQASAETGIPKGMPLIATGTDKSCETLGLSVITKDKASLSFGSTSTVNFCTENYVEPEPFMPPYLAAMDGFWNPEREVFRGYWLVSWFKREFAAKECMDAEREGVSAEDVLNRRLHEIPPGCNGLILQPYFTADVNMPMAKGAVIGFSDVHTRIHVYRAIIEGINHSLYIGLRQLEKRAKTKIKTIYVAGGGSQSSEICQITADMFGLPVVRTQTHEACGIGSAMIAFKAMGYFKSYEEACDAMVHETHRYEPDMKNHRFYDEMNSEIFSKIFDRLVPLYSITERKCKAYGLDKFDKQ